MHLAAWILAALLFCWLFISVAGTVVELFGFVLRSLRESHRDRAERRRRAREAERWGLRE